MSEDRDISSSEPCVPRDRTAEDARPPAAFPSCADAVADFGDVTRSLLKRAGIFPMFSVHNPKRSNVPLPSPTNPDRLVGMKVYEEMHRFAIHGEQPDSACGVRASNRVGEPISSIEIDWRVIPDDYVARPGELPPPTDLDPTRPQRFAMYNGTFRYKDCDRSGFHGFGTGRTFPCVASGRPQLRIGAVVDILQGFGKLRHLQGNVVINGFITPPNDLALGVILRAVDPKEILGTRTALSPLRTIPLPDPEATFLAFLGEADPDRPIKLNTGPDGRLTGASVYERLRLASVDCDVSTASGLRGNFQEGPLIGSLSFFLRFNPVDPTQPMPLRTTEGLFTFFDRCGRTVGTLEANIVEGWGFSTVLAGVPPPVVRVVGVGPIRQGTGAFGEASGMLSINGIISIGACTPSILYVFRLADPDYRYRAHTP